MVTYLRQRGTLFLGVLPLVCIAAAWELAAWILGPGRLPGLARLLRVFVESAFYDPIILLQGGGDQGYLPHVIVTMLNTCWGVAVGAVSGFAVAILVSWNRAASWMIDSAVELMRVVPPLIFVPFAMLVLGSSGRVEVVSVATYSGLAMVVYTTGALANVPAELIALGRLLGAGKTRLLLTVQIPAILPVLIGPIRIIVSLGLGISVVAEFLAAPAGIGRVMKFAFSYARVDLIAVGVIWAVLLVVFIDAMIEGASAILFRWTTRRSVLTEQFALNHRL